MWHNFCQGSMDRARLRAAVAPIRQKIELLPPEAGNCGDAKTERSCKELLELPARVWRFVEEEGLEATNIVAERAIRDYVIMPEVELRNPE